MAAAARIEVVRSVRLLSAGPFVTMLDRFALAPVLIPIARDFHKPLGAVAFAATVYFFVYGLSQPFWGFLSDHSGRMRVIRMNLAAAGIGCFATALAPNLPTLLAARILTAVTVCSILPTAMVYVGDMVPFGRRQNVIADLLAAVALGTAAATLFAGVSAHYVTWRLAFALPGAIALVLAFVFRRLPESTAGAAAGSPREQLRRTWARPWARFLVLFAIPEGAMVLGFFVYLAPALEATGSNTAVAGLVAATYGVAVLVGTQVVKRVAGSVRPAHTILLGGAMVVAGYLVAAIDQHPAAIVFASMMVGGCYAFLHSTIQAWATDLVPEARGTGTALFVTGAFTGAAIASGIGAGLAQSHNYGALFLGAAVLSVPVVLVLAVTRARYSGSSETLAAPS